MSSSSRWWYGVALFPLVVLTAILSRFALRRFVNISNGPLTNEEAFTGLAAFVLSTLTSWLGILVALVVLASLALDVRALRRDDAGAWTPSLAWVLAGLAHLVAAVFAPVLVLSVPTLSYYVYRRYGDGRREA